MSCFHQITPQVRCSPGVSQQALRLPLEAPGVCGVAAALLAPFPVPFPAPMPDGDAAAEPDDAEAPLPVPEALNDGVIRSCGRGKESFYSICTAV